MTKLAKDNYPAAHTQDDFVCFSPAATKDGEFSGVMIADLGCFTQDGKDSNKFYHGAVVQSKKDSKWYTYFEWGRTGGSDTTFQFEPFSSKSDAADSFEKQLHKKNDKRGAKSSIVIPALRPVLAYSKPSAIVNANSNTLFAPAS